jgi:hypothetical protein
LIVEKEAQFILKGKSNEQIAGYLYDIEISNYLLPHGFSVRTAIKTHEGNFHYEEDGTFWELKTYIPAAVVDFGEYNDNTLISLAELNTSYINTSLNRDSITKLNLKARDFSDITETVGNILQYHDILKPLIGETTEMFTEWFNFAHKVVKTILDKHADYSIIHNDLNNKNILLDLDTMKVVSFIDWDHGCISTPLKDIIEPINMFYDLVPQNYDQMRLKYLDAIKSRYQLRVNDSELNLLEVYFYTLNKWNYITTFARFIKELGNSTNELSSFENVIVTQVMKLKDIGKKYSIF